MSNLTDWITAISSAVMACSIFLVCIQINLSKRQSQTTFEDNLAKEFRELIKNIPIDALLGEELSDIDYNKHKIFFYKYIDLTNEECFLYKKGRIRKETWEDWCEGIESLLTKPTFNKAWMDFKEKLPNSFKELRCLESKHFKIC